MSDSLNPRSKGVEWCLIGAFALCVGAPVIVQATGATGPEVIQAREKRVPAPAPQLPRDLDSWAAFPRATENWYAERFGLRNQLLYAQHWIKLEVYDESPVDRVVIGRDDWLFTDGSDALACYQGSLPFTQAELTAWRESLEARHDWLAAQGIEYALILVPGKAVVYPEQVPVAYEPIGPSRRQQFLAELGKSPRVNIIDLAPALIAERAHDTTDNHAYYPLGVHWTARGALASAAAIFDALPARFGGKPLETLDQLICTPSPRGDDFSHQFLVAGRFDQGEYQYKPPGGWPARHIDKGEQGGDYDISTWITDDPERPRALIFRDSFGNMILPMLAPHFSRMHDITSLNFTPSLVDELKPDVVMELFVDLTFAYQLPQRQLTFSQADLAAGFEVAEQVLLPPAQSGEVPKITGLRETPIRSTPTGAVIRSDGTGSAVLPEFAWRPDQIVILKLDLSAPAPTHMSLYYPLLGVNAYREKQASDVPLHAGRQTIYVALPPPVAPGPIAILPGRASGDYVIHNVEARATTR